MTSSSKLEEAETKSTESGSKTAEPGPEEAYEEAYYVCVFNRLEKEGKHTWNWAAFFFATAWMRYRKMFVAAVLCEIATFILSLSIIIGTIIIPEQVNPPQVWVLVLLTQIFCSILCGYFGNYLYYLHAKSQISIGFHLVDRYRCTSVLAIFGGWWSILAFWLADFLARKEYFSKHKLTNTEFTEKNVRKFLRCKHKNHKYGRVAELVACMCITELLYYNYNIAVLQKQQTQVTASSSHSKTSSKTKNDPYQNYIAKTTQLSLSKINRIMQIRKSDCPVKEYLKSLLPTSWGEVFIKLY